MDVPGAVRYTSPGWAETAPTDQSTGQNDVDANDAILMSSEDGAVDDLGHLSCKSFPNQPASNTHDGRWNVYVHMTYKPITVNVVNWSSTNVPLVARAFQPLGTYFILRGAERT